MQGTGRNPLDLAENALYGALECLESRFFPVFSWGCSSPSRRSRHFPLDRSTVLQTIPPVPFFGRVMNKLGTHLRNKLLAGAVTAAPIVIIIFGAVWLEQHTQPL